MFIRSVLYFAFCAVSLTLWAAEEGRLTFRSDLQRGDINKPEGIWPLLGVGMGVMDSGDRIRTGGVSTHVKILGSYYFDGSPWVADAGVGLHNEFLTQDGGDSDTITSMYTELAARYQFTNRWQLGAIWNTLVDNPHRYHSNNGNLVSFMGIQVLKEFAWSDRYMVRAGGRAMTDVGIGGETINTVMGELQVSFGDSASKTAAAAQPSPVQPVAEHEVPVTLAPHLARQALQSQVEPGQMHFEADSTKIMDTSRQYLRRLAHALANNRQLFDKIEVVGHSDQRGTHQYNKKLSENRARVVANSLISAGINERQITVIGKGKAELLTHSDSAAALARNRRVELQFTGVKSQAALKNLIDSVAR